MNNAIVSLDIPGFSVSPAPGSSTSQTISAGQQASFSLTLASGGSFSGTVNLNCAISRAVTTAPTCNLSKSSIQFTGNGTQTVTVTVGTAGAMTGGTVSYPGLPSGMIPFEWLSILVGAGWLWVSRRRRLPGLGVPLILLMALSVSCGGRSQSSHNSSGTPPGTYAVTVTRTAGNLSHNVALKVIVH